MAFHWQAVDRPTLKLCNFPDPPPPAPLDLCMLVHSVSNGDFQDTLTVSQQMTKEQNKHQFRRMRRAKDCDAENQKGLIKLTEDPYPLDL